jgi:S1-C subfamily serine protease
MSKIAKATFERVKKATVAVALYQEPADSRPSTEQPFTIVGTGFCIDSRGIIITCRHVIEAFMEKNVQSQIDSIPVVERSKPIQKIPEVRSAIPHALFYVPKADRPEIHIIISRVDICTAKTDMDLGALRLYPHSAFPTGYPTLDIESFENVHEGLEIATCGFPLGNHLFKQLGTVTSSFSRGIISSIIPAEGIKPADVTGFQLDLRVTHGNSGGPVFSWESGKVFGASGGRF